MDEMDNNREEVELGRNLEDGTHRIQFLLRSVYDLLPLPTNIHKWGLTENMKYDLCGKRGTLEHILSS